MSYFKSVRFRLFLMSGALQILVAIIFITAAVISSNMILKENSLRIMDSVEQTILTATEEWRVTTQGFASIIANPSAELADAVRNADHDAIMTLAGDSYIASGADGMTVTDMEGIALARLNIPDRFGDSAITSMAIADALEGQTVSYMYATNSNGFSVTAGVPMIYGGEQLGSIFMSRRLDKESVMQDLKAETACEIVLYQGDVPVYSSFGDADVSAGMFEPLTEEDLAVLKTGSSITRTANFNGSSAAWLYTPLAGRGGEIVGTVLSINTADAGGWVMVMWAVLFLGLVLVISPVIHLNVKSVSAPLKQLASDAGSLSRGDMSVNITQTRSDEIGILQGTMKSLTVVINNLIAELAGLAEKHGKQGLTDSRLEVSNYEGAYAEVAAAINDMLDNHISSKRESLECIAGIVAGNFDAPLREFPGQEAYINESVDGLRSNIRGVVQEIKTVAGYAAAGDLSFKVDSAVYKGDWVALMEELNGIMTAVDTPLSELIRVILAMERGDFSERVHGDFKGVFGEVRNALNSAMEAVASYIDEINSILEGIAAGDLTLSIKREYIGQFKMIKNSINSITGTLDNTMAEIAGAAEQTLSGAAQVSNSSQDLAHGATEQAGSIEELSAAVSEIESKSRENVDNTVQASKLAAVSRNNAENGNAEMQLLLKAMDDIASSSAKISGIIKTIDGIAFQTNLLALNASVEAARAGEHGKGFAVVAGEVRNLSNRSSNAAQESNILIQEAMNSIEDGKKRANETAESLAKIVGNVIDVASVIDTINDASAKQSESIEQVASGIGQISSVVQSNTATSEESAAASQQLSAQAETLKKMISFFKTK